LLSAAKAIGDVIVNDPTITGILATIPGGFAVFNQNPIPTTYNATFPSINYYRNAPSAVLNVWTDQIYTLNCWDTSFSGAQDLQESVAEAFNRTSYGDFEDFQATLLPVIEIKEEGTYYNGLVEVRARANKNILD
jgi:hypothetical protein